MEPKKKKRINDLLYLLSLLTNCIHGEVSDILRGYGKTNEELKDSILYIIDERFSFLDNQ